MNVQPVEDWVERGGGYIEEGARVTGAWRF
jgi:hypothetical protein